MATEKDRSRFTAREIAALGRERARPMLGGVVDEGAPVDRFRRRQVGRHVITLRHLRLWMWAVPQWAGREGSDRWWRYITNYRVVPKIALRLEAGSFYRFVLEGLMRRGSNDRLTIRLVKYAAERVT